MNAKAARLIASTLLALSFSVAVVAQNNSLSGTIKDQSGVPVPKAKISLKNVSTGQVSETQSDAEGKYTFAGIVPGQYELSASADGFAANSSTVSITAAASAAPQVADVTLTSTTPSLADLGFNTAQTQSNPAEQARLDKRTHMLKVHQKMGLITAGPLLATIIAGFTAGGKNTSSSSRDFHAALGAVTGDLYFTTAYFAIRAPKIKGTETRGPIRVHKTLAWIHGPGMILTSILGPMAFDQKSKGEKVHGIASLHGPVAIVTGAAFGAALLSVSVKF